MADSHQLHRLLDVVGVRVGHQVVQHQKRMMQSFSRSNTAILVHRQHFLQDIDELRAVHLLGHRIRAGQVRVWMNFDDVVQAVEDVLSSLQDRKRSMIASFTRFNFQFN